MVIQPARGRCTQIKADGDKTYHRGTEGTEIHKEDRSADYQARRDTTEKAFAADARR